MGSVQVSDLGHDATSEPWVRREVIGGATLYLADMLELLPQIEVADHIVTDPPYEDELHAAVGKINRIRNDGRTVPEELGFEGVNANRSQFASAMVAASRGWVLAFTLAEGVRVWRDDLQAAQAKYDTCLFWVKPDSSPRFNGQGAARGAECIVTAWAGKGYRSWNAGGKRGVYTHLVNAPGRVSAKAGGHPTEKPLDLMAALLNDFTKPQEVVLDPFMGSGSTGVAALRLGRRFVGIERDPQWFDLAVKRLRQEHERLESQADMFAPYQKAIQTTMWEALKPVEPPAGTSEPQEAPVAVSRLPAAPEPPAADTVVEAVVDLEVLIAAKDGGAVKVLASDFLGVGSMAYVHVDADGHMVATKGSAETSNAIAMSSFTPGATMAFDAATGRLHKVSG